MAIATLSPIKETYTFIYCDDIWFISQFPIYLSVFFLFWVSFDMHPLDVSL